jgi:hypothetical protein
MHGSLPAAVREKLNPRHAVKVRVTHDQKSNQVLAKIIKARITDLDIYNPQSKLDCRISINFEMKYDGDIEDIIAAGVGERIPDRNKDRLSYTQSHYQIDLTQVTQTTSVNVSSPSIKLSRDNFNWHPGSQPHRKGARTRNRSFHRSNPRAGSESSCRTSRRVSCFSGGLS